jgi:alpha-L-fucosidase
MSSLHWYTQDPWKAYLSWFSPRWAQPIDEFDPEDWVVKLKRGGFRIAVLHAKHHDGICFFQSKYRYKNPPRDYFAEFVEAAHKQDIRVMT